MVTEASVSWVADFAVAHLWCRGPESRSLAKVVECSVEERKRPIGEIVKVPVSVPQWGKANKPKVIARAPGAPLPGGVRAWT